MLLLVALCCMVAALCALALAPSLASAEEALNLQARDGSIVLQDLGGGRAAFYGLITNGSRARRAQLWKGRLQAASVRYVAGDLNADQYTDVAALVKLPRGKSRLLVFTSTGERLRQTASWTGRLDWTTARLSVGFFVPDQTRDIAISTRPGGKTVVTAFRLTGKKIQQQALCQLPAGAVPAGAVMTSGDVNGDFHDELVFLGKQSKSTSRLVVLTNTDGVWGVQRSWTGSILPAGARLSCGDVDDDGVAEAVALTSGGAGTVTLFDCDADVVVATSLRGRAAGIPSAACRFSVTDMTGDDVADLVTLQKKGRTQVKLVVSVASGQSFRARTFWTGKASYGASMLSCTRTLPVVKRSNVYTLSVLTVAEIVSVEGEGATVTFSGAPQEVTSLRKGDVIIAEPLDPIIPDGLMRKVVSVSSGGGQTVLTTTGADLEDVFVQAEIDVSVPVSSEQPVQSAKTSRNGRSARGAREFGMAIVVPIEATLIDVGAVSAKVEGEFKAGVDIDCWVKIVVRWKYGFIPIPRLRARMALTFEESCWLELKVEGKVTVSKEIQLYEHEFEPIKFMVGPIPAWVTPVVELSLKPEVTASASATIHAEERMWATLGAEYDGGWKNLCDSGIELPDPTITTSKELDTKCAFIITGKGMIYSIFGPTVSFGPYWRTHFNFGENPLWRMFVGIEADVGVQFELKRLGIDWDYSWGPWTIAEWEVAHAKIDESKPVDTAMFTSCTADDNWHKGPVTVDFEGNSVGSPFKQTAYQLDGAEWRVLPPTGTKSSLTVSEPGEHPLSYRSYAQNGDAESVKNRTVKIDMTPPTATLTGADPIGQGQWRSEPVALHVSGADAGGSGLRNTTIYIAGDPMRYGSEGGDYILAIEGLTYVAWDAFDGAYNESETGAGEVKIDLLPPVTTASGADDQWHPDPVTVAFSASDWHGKVEGSGVAYTEYRVGRGGSYDAWTRGSSVTVSRGGDSEVQYRSVDNVGHVEETNSVHVKISKVDDTVAPTTSVSSYETGWNKADVHLTFTPQDPEPSAGLDYTEYKVGAAAWTHGTSVVINADGTHAVQYRSADLAANVEAAKSCVVKVDKTAPTCSVGGADSAWHATPVTLTFTGDDATSGVDHVEYAVDDPDVSGDEGNWQTGASVIIPAPVTPVTKIYTVRYRALDVAGNIGATRSAQVKIDTDGTAPVVTIHGGDAAWHKTDVALTFSAVDTGSGTLPTQYQVDPADPDTPDPAAWLTGSGVTIPAAANHSSDGIHTVWCQATDGTGRTDSASVQVKIDTTAPVTTWKTVDSTVDLSKWRQTPVELEFTTTDPGAAVSGIDKVYGRETGGLEWPAADTGAGGNHVVRDVAAGNKIWAATAEEGQLRASADGGLTWDVVSVSAMGFIPRHVACPTATTVWASNGDIDGPIMRSLDGGGTWSPASSYDSLGYFSNITALACQPGATDKAWVAVDFTSIKYTTDGGATWTAGVVSGGGAIGDVRDITCAPGGSALWAVGGSGILRSTDGGATWTRQTPPDGMATFERVTCRDAQHAWAFSGAGSAAVTTDGGATWSAWSNFTWPGGVQHVLYDVAFVSDTRFVGLGGEGTPVIKGEWNAGGQVWTLSVATAAASGSLGTGGEIAAAADGSGQACGGAGGSFLVKQPDAAQDYGPWTFDAQGRTTRTVSQDGSVTVNCYAVDAAGNQANPLASPPLVLIDTIAPRTSAWNGTAIDNPGGSGDSTIAFRATQTRWSPPIVAQFGDGSGAMQHLITSIEYSDSLHAVAGWTDATGLGRAGVVATVNGGSDWAAYVTRAGTSVPFLVFRPAVTDVAPAWDGTTNYCSIATLWSNATYTWNGVTMRSWVGDTFFDLGSSELYRAEPPDNVPGVKAVASPPLDPGDTWALGADRFWYKEGTDVTWNSGASVPLTPASGGEMADVCAYKDGSGARAWAVGLGVIYQLGTGSATRVWESADVEPDNLKSVACERMADGKLHIWALGADTMVSSDDGGATWSSAAMPVGQSFCEVTVGYRSVFALDGVFVWRKTLSQDGETWSDWVMGPQIVNPMEDSITSIAAASDTNVTAVGSAGKIWQTTTATPIWKPVLDGIWDTPIPGVPYEFRATDLAGNVETAQTYTEPMP